MPADTTLPHDRAAARVWPPLELLRCPRTGGRLERDPSGLRAPGGPIYPVTDGGIAMFAAEAANEDARRQQAHYDAIAAVYEENLGYPHTRTYLEYLDRALLDAIGPGSLGTMAEICCGGGAAVKLLDGRYTQAVGVDISTNMLARAAAENAGRPVAFVQGDATNLPLADGRFDTVVMLGGVHHVRARATLFSEIARILRPGGRFIFREPVSDLFLWRWLRAVVYRLSPMLDHVTERPLLRSETVPPLTAAGLATVHWSTHGFVGFCLFMNSDVLVFNRLFRFLPGIAGITRATADLDGWLLRRPLLRNAGLQVIGIARKY